MAALNAGTIHELLAAHQPPCVSIYLATQRAYPGSQQNPVQYRNLLGEVEASLGQKYPASVARPLLEKFRSLADDPVFWTHRTDGLAVFGSPDLFTVLDLHRAVPNRAEVADSFHLKPLLRLAQTADRYQVLCLTGNRARLLEGGRDGLSPVDLGGGPPTVEEAPAGSVRFSNGEIALSPHPPGNWPGESAGGDTTEQALDTEHFFLLVDRIVWERHSRASDLALVLVALPQNQVLFRKHSHNQHLLPQGVEVDPDALTPQQLCEAAWRVVAPRHQERVDRLIDSFNVAKARRQGSDDLDEVAREAHIGRVGTLLLNADRHIPGRLDPGDGHPVQADPSSPDVDDLLDDLGEKVLRQSGAVLVLPPERMPSPTGLAAIYRY